VKTLANSIKEKETRKYLAVNSLHFLETILHWLFISR